MAGIGRYEWVRSVGFGLVLGVAWGVVARVYMRMVSTAPGFSWTGTLFIVGLSAVFGLTVGIVHAARRRQGSRWWRLAAVPGLALFAGPGVPLLPAVLLGGWAVGTRRHWLLRLAAALLPLALPVLLWLQETPMERLQISPYVMVGGFWLLSALLALAGAVVLAPWPARRARTPAAAQPDLATV